MKQKMMKLLSLSIFLVVFLTGCTSAETGEEPAAGNPAFVDYVTVEMQGEHHYARVEGNYPDSCTRVSDVGQEVEGSTFKISLLVDRPEDLVCAQMMSPFNVNILLEVGGLMPGEYTVDVNGVVGSFTLGP
jgi:inhibitor of cysteine peptidase